MSSRSCGEDPSDEGTLLVNRIVERLISKRVMPGLHHSVAILPLPFRRCKIPLFCKNYVRKFRSVTAANSKKIRNGSDRGNG